MDHQSELEKKKYRNWVRGGLAYKYLKAGIETFVDEIVHQEHSRILSEIKHTPGLTCNHCSIQTLKPLHKSEKHPVTAGKDICPKGQTNCNCLFRKKQKCPNKVCDAIFEEILNSHGSTPPAPNWKNTNILNWCSVPWEIAKCFINSPGYSDKVSACDMDVSGLLHALINNINLHEHLSANIDGNDVFSKAIEGRNTIFHSPAMELEDYKVNKYIDNIIAILEDEKELKSRGDAKQAVAKLKQLKDRNFIISTHDEVEVCRDAMTSINNRSEELKEMIHDAKDDIDAKQTSALKAFDDKSEKALADAVAKLDQRNENQPKVMKQTIELLKERIRQVELDSKEIKKRLTQIERNVNRLNAVRNIHQTHLIYVQQKKEFQRELTDLYKNHYIKTWISPLKVQDKDVNINEVYVAPNMVVKEETDEKIRTSSRTKNNCVTPNQTLGIGTGSNTAKSRQDTEHIRAIHRYKDIFQTNGKKHKKIYVTGDVGSGKSSLGKMIVFKWCRAMDRNESTQAENFEEMSKWNHILYKASETDHRNTVQDENIDQMKKMIYNWCAAFIDETENVEQLQKFDFLFFIPLQRMSGLGYDIKDMIKILYKDFASTEVIERILAQEAERCLIIADGLDEWTPPKTIPLPHHVSYGIPNGDGIRDATFITLSRSSAKGILNMRSTEFDQKIELLGLKKDSVTLFTRKYLSKLNKNDDSFLNEFIEKIKKSNLQHLEQTPFLLQQLIWMYCSGVPIGQSVSDIYSNILNVIFRWCESKKEEEDSEDEITKTPEEFEQMRLPKILLSLPRCKINERLIFLLSKLSFSVLTDEIIRSTFGRSELLKFGIKKADIATFLKLGILVEDIGFDPTYEKTYFSFVHISYLEFFAAVYISSHCKVQRNIGETILDKLFMKFESADDILQLSNLLKMVCGLSPFLIGEISILILRNVRKDKSLIEYRTNQHKLPRLTALIQSQILRVRKGENDSVQQGENIAGNIQDLTSRCLFECGPDGPTEISLCDILIRDQTDIALLWKCNADHAISLSIDIATLPVEIDILKRIKQFNKLEFICFYCTLIDYSSAVFKLYLLLAQINVNVKYLSLMCNIPPGFTLMQWHIFNLSKYRQLQSISLHNVWCILGSKVNNLNSFYFSQAFLSDIGHQVKEQFSSSLTQTFKNAVHLRHVTLEDKWLDFGHKYILDLSKLSQIKSIHLDNFPCQIECGFDVKHLEKVYISILTDREAVTHDFCEQLSSSLGKAVSLKQLYLNGLQCNSATCDGHTIDLSGHVQLQSIHLDGYLCTFGSGVKHLETVYISGAYNNVKQITHEFCEQLSSSLRMAVSLKQLYLNRIQCNGVDCEGHTIDLSGHAQLQSIKFQNCAFILNNAQSARNLEEFDYICQKTDWVHHGPEILLLESLSQAVSIKHLKLKYFGFSKGCTVDLSKYDQLQSIQFEGDFSVSGLSTKSLEKISVNNFSNVDNLIYLCSGSRLKRLTIGESVGSLNEILIPRTEIFTRTNLGRQNLKYLESLEVTDSYIVNEDALTFSPRMLNIRYITFRRVEMSPQTWRKFVDSLLSLKQCVHVSCYSLTGAFEQAALEYLRKNAPVLRVSEWRRNSFDFTKKQLSEV